MKKIVVDQINSFITDYKILPDQKYSFIAGKSTITNLLLCFNCWSHKLDHDIICFKFSDKVFDKVPN